MKQIFIDANIYLSFFDSNKPELKKLLDSLLEIRNNLFISSQIVHEVNRNKLDVAKRSLINHFDNLANIKPISLPEHLEAESTNLKNWNTKSKEINKKQKELQKNLEKIIHKTLEEIMRSDDKVSQTFSILFRDSKEASEEEIKAARYRKEIGNPPGKPNDALGDQVSWELFKNNSTDLAKIWIITKDSDYYTAFKNRIYLNPLLYNELISVNSNRPSIFCFESLAEGLKHFNQNSLKKIDNLPTEEELKIITQEEFSDSEITVQNPQFFPIIEQGKLTYMRLPTGFNSPIHYLNYLRAFDSDEL